MPDLQDFIYGIFIGGTPPLFLWAYAVGKWREELSNVDKRLERVESLLDALASNSLERLQKLKPYLGEERRHGSK